MKERLCRILERWNQRNTEYYQESFRKLKEENKATFNFAAAFGTITWLIFRKMYGLAILVSLVWSGIQVFAQTFLRSSSTSISIALSLMLFVGFGFFGNSLYYDTVKSRVARGYAKMTGYNPIDPVWGLIIIGFLVPACIVIVIPLLVFTKIISSSAMSMFSFIVQMFFMAIAWMIDYKKFQHRESVKPIRVTWKSIDEYLVRSDSKHMFASMCVWGLWTILSLFVLVVVTIAGVRVIGDKIRNQTNKIVEEINKVPNNSGKLHNLMQYNQDSRPKIDEGDYRRY